MARFLIFVLLSVVVYLAYRNHELSHRLGQLEGRQVCESATPSKALENGATPGASSKPDLRAKLSSIQARLRERKAKLDALVQKRDALVEAGKKKDKKVDSTELDRMIAQKNEEIDRLKAEMGEVRAKGSTPARAPEAAYAEVRSRLTMIEGKIHDAKAGLARLRPETNPEDRTKRNELKDQLSAFHAELKQVQEEQKRILGASEGADGERPEAYLKRRMDTLRKEVVRLKKRTSEASLTAPEDHSVEIAELNRQIQTEHQSIQALELAISEIETLMR